MELVVMAVMALPALQVVPVALEVLVVWGDCCQAMVEQEVTVVLAVTVELEAMAVLEERAALGPPGPMAHWVS